MTLTPSTSAQRPPLFASTTRLLNDVALQGRRDASLQSAALRFLRAVAEGNEEELSPSLLGGFRVLEGSFQPGNLKVISIRAKAFEHIGRLASPEALAYLESIDRSKFSAVEDQPLEKAIVRGIYWARLGQITDQQRRWEFQASLLSQPNVNRGDYDVKGLALNGLCSGGALAFLSDVERFHNTWGFNPQTEARIQLCETKMLLVTSYPDRVTALASALRVDVSTPEAEALRSWAMHELGEMNTRESRAALQAFVDQAGARVRPDRREGTSLENALWNAKFLLGNVMEP